MNWKRSCSGLNLSTIPALTLRRTPKVLTTQVSSLRFQIWTSNIPIRTAAHSTEMFD